LRADVDMPIQRGRPTKIDINGKRVTKEFRDGWRVG
jgi:hypothetical protein